MLDGIDKESLDTRSSAVNSYMLNKLDDTRQELREPIIHLPRSGGKRLRPLVMLLSAESLGRRYQDVVPIAASIESLHTSTLIQDDHPDMDDDKERRGVETVHSKFGGAESQLASNILMSKTYSWITESDISDSKLRKVNKEMDLVIEDLCIGQKMDLEFEERNDVSEEEYLNMISNKTASIYETSAKLGCIASEVSKQSTVNKMCKFGHELGIGFQIIDDVLDFDSSRIGKDRFSDIQNNKSTIVTVHAYNQGVPVFDNSISVEERFKMIRAEDSIDYARGMAEDRIESAVRELDKIDFKNEKPYKMLRKIAKSSLHRTY